MHVKWYRGVHTFVTVYNYDVTHLKSNYSRILWRHNSLRLNFNFQSSSTLFSHDLSIYEITTNVLHKIIYYYYVKDIFRFRIIYNLRRYVNKWEFNCQSPRYFGSSLVHPWKCYWTLFTLHILFKPTFILRDSPRNKSGIIWFTFASNFNFCLLNFDCILTFCWWKWFNKCSWAVCDYKA